MNYICLFSKPPIPGQTKSRLATTIGTKAASELACAMLQDICTVALNVKNTVPQLWHPPGTAPQDFDGMVPHAFTFQAQQGDNLGQRMSAAFAHTLEQKQNNRVIIIGADCITHTPNSLCAALSDLNYYRVVIQPADDGGYVLVGQSIWSPALFNDIKWGGKDVYENSIKNMQSAGISYKKLSITFDVDTIDDLVKITNFIETNERPHTRTWMKSYGWI